jgi:restriction endonuclease Mrr
VLVDGQRLAALTIAHGVGVTPKRVEIRNIDSDYSEGE